MTVESACERYLANAGISPATRRAYGTRPARVRAWFGPDSPLEDVDVRVLADWVSDLGRVRERGKLSPSSISRKLVAVRSLLRYSLGAERVPDAALAPKRPRRLPDAPKLAEVEAVVDEFDDDEPLGLRNRALSSWSTRPGLRSAEAVALDLGDVDFEQELVHVRLGKGAKDRVVPLGEEAALLVARYLRDARPSLALGAETRSSSRSAAGGSTRRRCDGSSRTRIACATRSRRTCWRAAPTCARSRSCSATARSRRRRCTATSTPSASAACTTTPTRAPSSHAARGTSGVRHGCRSATQCACELCPQRRRTRFAGCGGEPRSVERDPDVDGFLALLAAQRSPRTVDAYRRDLAALGAYLGKPPVRRRSRSSSATRRSSRRRPRRDDDRAPDGRGAQLLPPPAAARHARRQPRRRRQAATARPAAAEDALAGRGRAADRRRRRDAAARAARPGARRAALRRRPPRLRGGRARQGGRRPRRPARARDRQGRQGARRPDRPRRGDRAAPLPLTRAPLPRPPPPPGALPERARRPAHPLRAPS